MFVTIINDCRDANAMGRQVTRTISLLGLPVAEVGIENDLEAAGNLIDILDAAEDRSGIVMVNVAPRHGEAKKWPNGTPFGYFYFKNILVISTIDGACLSLVKKLNLVKQLDLTDIPIVVKEMVKMNHLTEDTAQSIIDTQFRSYNYMPRLAYWLTNNIKIPSENYSLTNVPDVPKTIWWIDNFGNCKTTLLPEDIDFKPGKKIQTKLGELICYARLKDVPNHQSAFIIGSSGYAHHRFLEVIIQGKSAAREFEVTSGTEIL